MCVDFTSKGKIILELYDKQAEADFLIVVIYFEIHKKIKRTNGQIRTRCIINYSFAPLPESRVFLCKTCKTKWHKIKSYLLLSESSHHVAFYKRPTLVW